MGNATDTEKMENEINSAVNNEMVKVNIGNPLIFVGTVTYNLVNIPGVKTVKIKKHQNAYIFDVVDNDGNKYNARYAEPTMFGPVVSKKD